MTDIAEGDQGFFQVPKSSSNARAKRVYVGGLPKNLPTLEKDLADWMRSRVPDLTIASIAIDGRGKFPHALVDCGSFANEVISKLHQQSFRGRKLTVQRERRNNNKNNNNKFKTNANNKNYNKKGSTRGNQKHHHQQPQQHFGGWSKPKQPQFRPMLVEEASGNIGAVVAEEIKQAEDAGEDVVDVAIASAAAATFLAAMNGIADSGLDAGTRGDPAGNDGEGQSEEEAAKSDGFQLKAMTDLLADFGQADPNWQKQRVEKPTEDLGSSSDDSRLAPKGKAPIHIVLSSFGFRNGAPKRPEGWSYSQPLAALDCRERFASVPGYMEWRTGLSGAVKRALQQENDGEIQRYARTELADQVWDSLLEAQEAGHGYASPLKMTIHIGSETGKHRSVVLCEWAATAVRKKLRANKNSCIRHPVSVETYHRDVDRQKNNSSNGKQPKKKHDFAGDW